MTLFNLPSSSFEAAFLSCISSKISALSFLSGPNSSPAGFAGIQSEGFAGLRAPKPASSVSRSCFSFVSCFLNSTNCSSESMKAIISFTRARFKVVRALTRRLRGGKSRQDFFERVFVRGDDKRTLIRKRVQYWPSVYAFADVNILKYAVRKRRSGYAGGILRREERAQRFLYLFFPREHRVEGDVIRRNNNDKEWLVCIECMYSDHDLLCVSGECRRRIQKFKRFLRGQRCFVSHDRKFRDVTQGKLYLFARRRQG